MLIGDLVIRQEPVRLPAFFALPPLYKPYDPVSSGFFPASFYPVFVYKLSSAVRTFRVLIALYLKDFDSSLYSSQKSDIIIGMVINHRSRRCHLSKEGLWDLPFFKHRMTSYQFIL